MIRKEGRPYTDPLDAVWLSAVGGLGWRVVRSDEVFASWDGVDTLTISTSAGLDPDDSLAQMIFHEVCHALVEAERGGLSRVDWGLENIDQRDLIREYACHRLQAALAGPWGLREVLAPTTDHRPYYDALPPDPLGQSPLLDPAIPLARLAWQRAQQPPWSGVLQPALRATAALAAVLARLPWPPSDLLSQARPRHPTGLPPAVGAEAPACGACAWREADTGRCMQVPDAVVVVAVAEAGCLHWEAPLTEAACAACGACCRQGFDVVDLEADSPLRTLHPAWVSNVGFGPQLARPDGFCPALTRTPPYRCAEYALRPTGCRELEVGGEACREARRRVGLVGTPAAGAVSEGQDALGGCQ